MSPYTVRTPWPNSVSGQPVKFSRADAVSVLNEYVKNENLRRHMYACEAAMRAYAVKYNEDSEQWGIVGLLHDFDWEIHPTLEDHPTKGQAILARRGVPAEIRRAIMAHAPHTGTIAESMMEKCMFAVDELTGMIVACALVTPDKKLANITIDSIKKKLKQKAFAAKVSREDIANGIQLLGIPDDDHFATVLTAMQNIHESLGL